MGSKEADIQKGILGNKENSMKRIQYYHGGIPSSLTIDPVIFALLDKELEGLADRWCKRLAASIKSNSESNEGVSKQVRQMAVLKIAKKELLDEYMKEETPSEKENLVEK